MILQGYYTLITSKLRKDKTSFRSEFTGWKYYVNRDNFYVADIGEVSFVIDETDNIMIKDRTGYINVNKFDLRAKAAFTDMIEFMDSKYYQTPVGV